MKLHRTIHFATFVLLVAASARVHAEVISRISPKAADGVEGDGRTPGGGGPGRIQFLYLSDDFDVPATHTTITGFAWRPDQSNTLTDPITVEARLRLSSTPVDDLVSTFALNRGPDEGPVVFDGVLTFQTNNEPVGSAPKNFDYAFRFDSPFDYDPSGANNLLLEFEILAPGSQVGNWFIDAISTPGRVSSVSAPSLSAIEAINQHMSIWPAEFALYVLGDLNFDGEVNGLDVDPFVDVLLASRFDVAADMNGDGAVNGLDVDPFVAAVVGGTQQIPEPSTLLLALVALSVVGGWRKWGGPRSPMN